MGDITTIGLDLAKNVFQVHAVDEAGNVVLRKRLRRGQVLAFFAGLPSCLGLRLNRMDLPSHRSKSARPFANRSKQWIVRISIERLLLKDERTSSAGWSNFAFDPNPRCSEPPSLNKFVSGHE